MIKNSRQRNSIKLLLQSRTDHPTAYTIYEELRREQPNISLGTVYRNLKLMCSMGEIIKINCGDESDHFDGNPNPHYHHVCTRCGAVHDLPMKVLAGVNELAQNFTEHEILENQICFYGICKDCKDAEGQDTLMH